MFSKSNISNSEILESRDQVSESENEMHLHSNPFPGDDEQFRTLIETLGEGVGIVDPEENFIYSNSKAEKIFGVEPGGLIGKKVSDLVDKDTKEFLVEQTKLRQKGVTSRYNITATGKNSKPRYLSVTATPYLNSDGSFNGTLGVFRDITKQKEVSEQQAILESQLRQAKSLESLNTLVGGIAHDFNNILQRMFLRSEVIISKIEGNDELIDDFQGILDEGKRASRLVKQIHTFNRHTDLDLKAQTIHNIIGEALLNQEKAIPDGVKLKMDLDSNCGFIVCDSTQIHQIIINMCNNAVHAIGNEEGTISITLKNCFANIKDERIDAIVLTISDTGHGMKPEVLEQLFDPFFTTKSNDEGTGLGLTIIQGIVDIMDGQINVSSEVGKGTTFELAFPKSKGLTQIPSIKSVKPGDSGSHRVLFVDDDESMRMVGKEMLIHRGFKVDTAADGEEGRELFESNINDYDIIVIDEFMPKLNGSELAKIIHAKSPEIPVILSTGEVENIEQAVIAQKGISGFIMKPWTYSELIEIIERYIKH